MANPYAYPSRVLVYSLINTANGTRYNPTDVAITNIREDTTTTDFRDTKADVVGVTEEGFSGTITVRYARLDVAEVFGLVTNLAVRWEGQTSTLELMEYINSLYGTKFNEEDVVIEYFNPNTLPITVAVTMSPTSPAWKGTLNVQVVPFSQALAAGLISRTVQPWSYPTGQVVKTQGPLYLRPYDFDSYWSLLRPLQVGVQTNAISQSIATVINGFVPTTHAWTVSMLATSHNLTSDVDVNGLPALYIVYAGAPTATYTHRLGVDRIIVIRLSNTLCTDVAGYLVMHFSEQSVDLDTVFSVKSIGQLEVGS